MGSWTIIFGITSISRGGGWVWTTPGCTHIMLRHTGDHRLAHQTKTSSGVRSYRGRRQYIFPFLGKDADVKTTVVYMDLGKPTWSSIRDRHHRRKISWMRLLREGPRGLNIGTRGEGPTWHMAFAGRLDRWDGTHSATKPCLLSYTATWHGQVESMHIAHRRIVTLLVVTDGCEIRHFSSRLKPLLSQ
jgi:hypothetical protein